jgi:hypothetical protein
MLHQRPKKLTPFQQMEQSIREAERDENLRPLRRAGEELRGANRSAKGRQAGLTEASQPGSGPTEDDLTPETLIHEDGALSPLEEGDDTPADRAYRIVGAQEIGVGFGLDEAELAHVDPLDGEPWDEDDEDRGMTH